MCQKYEMCSNINLYFSRVFSRDIFASALRCGPHSPSIYKFSLIECNVLACIIVCNVEYFLTHAVLFLINLRVFFCLTAAFLPLRRPLRTYEDMMYVPIFKWLFLYCL